MYIKVNSLKSEFDKLNRLINNYNLTVLNLYNELSYSNNHWQDGNSLRFYDNVKLEKQNNIRIVSELNEIKNIYNLIIRSYESFGNIIKCELKNKYAILTKIDNYISKIQEIISSYNIDVSFCPGEASMIQNQISRLNNELNRIVKVRDKINSYLNKIEEIEKTVSLSLSKIDIKYLKESDYRSYL